MKQPSHLEPLDLRITHFINNDKRYYAFYLDNHLESICVHTCDGSYVALKNEAQQVLLDVLETLEEE